jgi:ACS family hexuronate transporter-like MFS transporter
MFACTALNYMDRQAMSLVGPQVKKEFGLDNVGFGWVLAAFQLSYALFQWPAGYVVDRRDVRRTYAAAVVWWSLAGIATAFAPGIGILMVFRGLLGVGESFNWPCALRVTAGILPPGDRSLGNGIFNSGAAIGAVLTPLVVAPLAVQYGWRVPFVVLGVFGLIWVSAWLFLTRGVELCDSIQREDEGSGGRLSSSAKRGFGVVVGLSLAVGLSGFWLGAAPIWWGIAIFMVGMLLAALIMPMSWLEESEWARSLGEIVRNRRFWIIASVGVTINVTWHFLGSWMGTFFQEERRLGLFAGAMVTSLPFLAADAGNLLGGGLTRSLVSRGRTPAQARKIVMVFCLALVSLSVWVGFARSDAVVIGLLCLTAMGAAAYMVNFFAFGQDVSPRHTGLVVGYLGGLGNLFAAGFTPLAGWISQGAWGFTPNFIIVGLLPLIGLFTLLIGWREHEAERKPI